MSSLTYASLKTKEQMLNVDHSNHINSNAFRRKLPETVQLVNWNRNNRGWCNHRDGPILGKHPGIIVPFNKCDSILLSIFLNHATDDKVTAKFCKQYKMPKLLSKDDVDIDDRMRNKMPIGAHQQWISPHNHTLHWNKRPWELSRNFKDMAGTKFPTFIIVLTPCVKGRLMSEQSVRTCAFEIGSKEQPNKSKFERGNVLTTTKRRTPETEKAHESLRIVQADLLRLRDEIKIQEEINVEYQTRISFGLAIVQSDPTTRGLATKIEHHLSRMARIFSKH